MKIEKACGTVIERNGKILVIHQQNGFWGFPKGHIEAGETEAETAVRETFEETGLWVELNEQKRFEFSYDIKDKNVHKVVVLFTARVVDDSRFSAQIEEGAEMKWVNQSDVEDVLTYDDWKAVWRKIRAALKTWEISDSESYQKITSDKKFLRTKNYIQHGTVSVYDHSISVAKASLKISRKLHLKVNTESMVKVALLHDYFLYDWHDKDHPKLHGFRHASFAAKNARRDFGLTDKEYKAIRSHMFPLNLRIPTSREALVLTLADKYCATKETIKNRKH